MSEIHTPTLYAPHVILDAAGDPIGVYRENQDPSDAQRFHAVPKINAYGEPILDAGEPVVSMLPLEDPRALAQIDSEGLKLDGNVLIEKDEDVAPSE